MWIRNYNDGFDYLKTVVIVLKFYQMFLKWYLLLPQMKDELCLRQDTSEFRITTSISWLFALYRILKFAVIKMIAFLIV